MPSAFPPAASRALLWLLLALPAATLLWRWQEHGLWLADLVAPSGEWSARLLIAALMLTPLRLLLPRVRAITWLAAHRRAIGVAAFCYAVLHLGFYVADLGAVAAILDELALPGIWTGWAALLLMVPLAATSNDRAVRAMRVGWKRLQRLAYPAALLTLAHWIIVHDGLTDALAQAAPLLLLELYRVTRMFRRSTDVSFPRTAT